MGIICLGPFDVLQSLFQPYGVAYEGASSCRVVADVGVLKLQKGGRQVLRDRIVLDLKMVNLR